MLFKNTWVTALDVGGRLLGSGETGDLDPASGPVADHVAAGWLTPVQTPAPIRVTKES